LKGLNMSKETFDAGLRDGRCGYPYGSGIDLPDSDYRSGFVFGFRNPNVAEPAQARTLDDVAADKSWRW
jgi:hypothetical protein